MASYPDHSLSKGEFLREFHHPISRLKRKTKSRRTLDAQASRSFFKLAAALAGPLPELKKDVVASEEKSSSTLLSLQSSAFLDSGYQEKSLPFIAYGERLKRANLKKYPLSELEGKMHSLWPELKVSSAHESLEKEWARIVMLQQPREELWLKNMSIPSDEFAIMLRLNLAKLNHALIEHAGIDKEHRIDAISFHRVLAELLGRADKNPLMLIGKLGNRKKNMFIHRARMFSGHRLRMKSWQNLAGAHPSIRYFHAAFSSDHRLSDRADVVYWIRFNAQQKPVGGGFIEHKSLFITPWALFCPNQVAKDMLVREKTDKAINELLRLYLISVDRPMEQPKKSD